MMNKPRISIITVSYNAIETIEKTIKSVIDQTYSNIEYIIIDGGSTDGTVDIIKKYSNHISYWVSESDNGIYDAMNKGILKSSGEWINFMNCGDCFYDHHVIENIFSYNYNNADVLYGNSKSYGVDGQYHNYISGDSIHLLEFEPIYRHGASFVRTEVHKRFLFDLSKIPTIKYALDFDLIYRLYKSGVTFKKVNFYILIYEKEGISNNQLLNKYFNYKITSEYKFSYVKFKHLFKGICKLLFYKIINIFR